MVHQFAVPCEGRSRKSFQLDDLAVRITCFIAGPSRDIAVGRIVPAVELALPGRPDRIFFRGADGDLKFTRAIFHHIQINQK